MLVFSCSKQQERMEIDKTGLFDISSLTFNFSVNSPDETKAVKTGWETGDKIFVFFSGLSTGYVTFEYGASSWCEPEVSGTGSISPEGTLTAVYLPFGNDETPSHGDSGWTFGQIYYSYYLVSQNTPYTIDGDLSTLSATIMMQNPQGFVQFFVADEDAVDGAYTLESYAVRLVGLSSVGDNGIVTQTRTDYSYWGGVSNNSMPGFAYQGGYLFSGKLVPDALYATDGTNGISFVGRYYFTKTKVSDGSREDYCTSADTLTSHFAARLPANGSTKWVPVGPDNYADLGGDVLWATCNLSSEWPEERGAIFSPYSLHYDTSGSPTTIDLDTVTFPERDHAQWLIDNCIAEAYMINGQVGLVMKSTTTDAFIFLPNTHRNWGGSYVSGYDRSHDRWYPLDFDCRSGWWTSLHVNLASTYENGPYTGVAVRTVVYKDGIPQISRPFDDEVEL